MPRVVGHFAGKWENRLVKIPDVMGDSMREEFRGNDARASIPPTSSRARTCPRTWQTSASSSIHAITRSLHPQLEIGSPMTRSSEKGC